MARKKIVPSLHNLLSVKKGDFFLKNHNKEVFLEILGTQLCTSGISVMHSDRDADVDIASSALTVAKSFPVTRLG